MGSGTNPGRGKERGCGGCRADDDGGNFDGSFSALRVSVIRRGEELQRDAGKAGFEDRPEMCQAWVERTINDGACANRGEEAQMEVEMRFDLFAGPEGDDGLWPATPDEVG